MIDKPSFSLRIFLVLSCLFLAPSLFAQSAGSPNLLVYILVVIGAILLIAVIMQVADNLLQIEAKKRNVESGRVGLLPTIDAWFSKPVPRELRDEDVHTLNKGYDILLEGEAAPEVSDAGRVTRYALQPKNWVGMSPIPKLHVEVGDTVKCGQPLLYDKKFPEVQYVAPVSGEVIEVNRAEKRSIAEVVILADKEIQYTLVEAPDLEQAAREEIVAFLQSSGGWAHIVQRPFDIVPASDSIPVNIFISTFDTAPLAPDLNLIVEGRGAAFQKGLDVLGTLTPGEVHLGLDARDGKSPSPVFRQAAGVEKHWFRGPHPCGNVGIQIHHVDPIRPSRKVWVLGVQDVITIGNLWLKQHYDASRIVALTGEPLANPSYVSTRIGANLGELLKDNLPEGDFRVVSGDVLTGKARGTRGYLGFYDDQVTVLREGDYYEMFGWLVPSMTRPSVSRTYPNFMFPDMRYVADTNTHGERRAFVMTGQYEKMLPMDIYPQHLMKAIMTNNYENMEGLGIHELSEEDVALCEFACTSKMPLQSILREGLEMMREQG